MNWIHRVFLLLAVTVRAIDMNMPGLKKDAKYYNYTQNGIISTKSLVNGVIGKNGLISKAQSFVNKFDDYDEYMHEMGGEIMKFLLKVEHELLPDSDAAPSMSV